MKEYLEDPKTDEEFYELIKRKRIEIDSLSISDEEREKLYSILEKNIQYHEEEKGYKIRENFSKIAEEGGRIGNDIIKIGKISQKTNYRLHLIKINQQIAIVKQKKTKEIIDNSLENQRKLEAKLTEQYWWQIKKQGIYLEDQNP